jgi:hypothetical protein
MNLNVKKLITSEEARRLLGKTAKEKHYETLITEKCIVKEGDETLFAYIPNAIPNNIIKNTYKDLKTAAGHTNNRGTATFEGSMGYGLKKDGTRSKTNRSKVEVRSGIIGYFDRYTRIPYCRTCAWTERNPKKWKNVLPLIHTINKQYETYCPEEYKKQKQAVENSSQDFVIKDTAFSTATVNLNWQSAFHRDKKNLDGGMAGMAVIGAGKYDGAHLCFPEYKIAVNITSGDVIVMNNTHLIHGNTDFKGMYGNYERISVVCYFRDNIQKCGTTAEELERAKKHGMFITKEL